MPEATPTAIAIPLPDPVPALGWRQRLPALGVGLLGILLSLWAYWGLHRTNEQQLRQRFEQAAAEHGRRLQHLLDQDAEVLEAAGGLFDASSRVERQEFQRFLAPLLRNHPEIEGIQWIARVAAAERAAYEAGLRAEGLAPEGILALAEGGDLVPAPAGPPEYLSITYAEPLAPQRAMIGLDMQRHPSIAALRQAVAQGRPWSSAPFSPMQPPQDAKAILLFRPVYRPAAGTSEEGPPALLGVVGLRLRPARVVEALLNHSPPAGMSIELLAPVEAGLTSLYHLPAGNGRTVAESNLELRLPLRLPGQEWQVVLRGAEEFRHQSTQGLPLAVLLGGLGLTGLLMWLLLHSARQTYRSAALARELEATNRRLNQAQQIGRIGNWELDLKTHRLWWSDQIYRIFELDPQRFGATYENFLNVIHPEDRERVNRAYSESVASRQPYDIVHRLRMTDGRIKYVRECCETWYDGAGQPVRSNGTVQDISEHYLAEQALRESEARFRTMFEQAGGGIAFADRDGALVMANDAFRRLLEYPPEALRGMNFAQFTHPEDLPQELLAYNEILAGQRDGYRLEKRYLNRHGAVLWVDLSVAVSRDAQGQPLFFVGMAFDITARKEAERLLEESRHRFEDLVNTTDGIVWEADAESLNFTFVSRKAEALLGYPIEDWYRPGFWGEHIHPEDRDWAVEYCHSASETLRPHQFEYRFLTRDGRVLWLQDIVTVLAEQGRPRWLRGLMIDITRHKETEERLRLFAKVFDNSGEAILITDQQARIQNVNQAFTRLTGYTLEEVRGKNPRLLSSGREDREFFAEMWRKLAVEGSWQGEIWDRRKDGEIYPKWLNISALRNEQGEICHYIGSFIDISQIKNAEASIRFLAHHDPLTGLPNRFTLQARLTQTLADARRFQHGVAVLFLDLDRFKTINDSLGHPVGDQLLIEVARRLNQSVRETDTVARLGGDEFVLVLPHINHPLEVVKIARGIVRTLSQPVRLGEQLLHTSPSIGVALFPGDGEDVETLLKNADTAMYHAKAQGRATYQFFKPEMNEAAQQRLSLENDLRLALERAEFRLHFQPQFQLANGRLAGLEALIRWQHPEQCMISPAKFIPVAEETGLILPIGDWVLREACRLARQWQQQGLLTVPVAVNVSARQFRQPGFVEVVQQILGASQLPPELLELEITESAVMEAEAGAVATLRRLHNMGVQLAIDDFGTGYSSLNYLKSFPLHKLKIDQSFVRDLEHDPNDAAISLAIIGLAHNLGLQVIAEGIETEAQLQLLRSHGCDTGQGFLLGRGEPAAETEALLKRFRNNGLAHRPGQT